VLERALLVINTPYTYFTILCDELAVASTGFAATGLHARLDRDTPRRAA